MKKAWTDQQIDDIIGILLRAGVILSALLVLFGGTLYLVRHGNMLPDYHVFRGEPSDLRNVERIIKDALSSSSRGMIQFGLLVLIATPVARVAFTILAFALQRDRIYVTVTLIVFAVLLYSLIGGQR
jgi:uncharacterized membrane protein